MEGGQVSICLLLQRPHLRRASLERSRDFIPEIHRMTAQNTDGLPASVLTAHAVRSLAQARVLRKLGPVSVIL